MTEYKISQEAMKKLKKDYVLLEVENIILGLCEKNIAKKVKKKDCIFSKFKRRCSLPVVLRGESMGTDCGHFVGYIHEISLVKFQKDFEWFFYLAKNKNGNKIFIMENEKGGTETYNDRREVLVTKDEAMKIEASVRDNKSGNLRDCAPKDKIKSSSLNEVEKYRTAEKYVMAVRQEISCEQYCSQPTGWDENLAKTMAEFLKKQGVKVKKIKS